ncbi:MAG: DUF2141 domain-containing protein [Rhodospirillaceae bacterium]
MQYLKSMIFFSAVMLLLPIRGPVAESEPETREGTPTPIIAVCNGNETYSIALEVHNVRKSRGQITVDLHDDNPEGFLKRLGRIGRVRAPAEAEITNICIPIEHPGVYAIAIYHDKDMDGDFDKNFLGLPSEPYGISNDPAIFLSAPPHSEAAFEVLGLNTPVLATLKGK